MIRIKGAAALTSRGLGLAWVIARLFHRVLHQPVLYALEEWGGSGRRPGRLRTEREQRAGQAAEEVGFGTCRGERKADASRGLDDTGGDFQETKPQRRELGSGQFPGLGMASRTVSINQ